MKRTFPAFQRYVCEGDHVECERDGFTLRATVYRDDCAHRPDERDDGFWPSREPGAAGYVLPQHFDREMRKAKRVMAAWEAGEWWYCGIAVTASKNGVLLTGRCGNALWGIEANYPISRGSNRNHYLRTVANELADEALTEARAKLATLCDCGGEG